MEERALQRRQRREQIEAEKRKKEDEKLVGFFIYIINGSSYRHYIGKNENPPSPCIQSSTSARSSMKNTY